MLGNFKKILFFCLAISKKRGNLEEMHNITRKNLEEMHNISYNNLEEMTLFILFGGIYMYFERKAYDELKKCKDDIKYLPVYLTHFLC